MKVTEPVVNPETPDSEAHGFKQGGILQIPNSELMLG